MRRGFCALTCWFILAFAPFSTFAQNNQMPPYGGICVLSTNSDPKTFNDIVAKETSSSLVTSLLFEGLTTIDPKTLQVIPALAERWQVSADGLQWVFYLRHDVRWFDGESLSADDVVFTFNELIYNPDIPSSSRDVFTVDGKMFKVEKIDAHTVRFTLPVPFAPFLRGMTQAILPEHALKSAVKNGRFSFTWGIDTLPKDIIGTGPFYLKEYQPGQRLVFQRNPLYWKKDANGRSLPYLNQIVYLIISDHNAQVLKFIDGELDAIDVRGEEYPLIKPLEGAKNFKLYDAGPAFGSNFLVFNQNPGANPQTGKPFVDPIKLSWFINLNFRKAIAHAMDKPKMISILYNGFGSPQNSAMSPSSGYFYNPNVPTYAYDLNEAKAILTKAGFIDRDGDGIIEDPQGHPLRFSLYTNGGIGEERSQIAAMMVADFKTLGIDVNLLTVEFNVLVSKLTSTYEWDAVVLGLTGGEEPHFGQNVWLSSGGLHMWNPNQSKPATAWEARCDEIFSKGVQELDEAKRKVLYDEHQRIIAEQLPLIYTVLNNNIYAIRNRFGNLNPTARGGVFPNIESIYVKDNQ